MPVNHGDSPVRVDHLVMVGSALVHEPRFLQFLYEFPCCHEFFIRIMRIVVKENIRTMRILIASKEFIQGERVPIFPLMSLQTGANGWLGTWSSKTAT